MCKFWRELCKLKKCLILCLKKYFLSLFCLIYYFGQKLEKTDFLKSCNRKQLPQFLKFFLFLLTKVVKYTFSTFAGGISKKNKIVEAIFDYMVIFLFLYTKIENQDSMSAIDMECRLNSTAAGIPRHLFHFRLLRVKIICNSFKFTLLNIYY